MWQDRHETSFYEWQKGVESCEKSQRTVTWDDPCQASHFTDEEIEVRKVKQFA